MLHSKNILEKLTVSMKEPQESFILAIRHPLRAFLIKKIHERNIQSLAKEIYKFLNGLSPGFPSNVFHKNCSNSYALRNRQELYSRNP